MTNISSSPETAHHVTLAACKCGTMTLQLRREDSSIFATAAIPLSGLDAFISAIMDGWEAAMRAHPTVAMVVGDAP